MPLNKAEQETLRTSAVLPTKVFDILMKEASEVAVRRSTVAGKVITKVRAKVYDTVAREIVDIMPASTETVRDDRGAVWVEILTPSVPGEGPRRRSRLVGDPRPRTYGRVVDFMASCAAAIQKFGWVSKGEAETSGVMATYERARDATLNVTGEDVSIAQRALIYWMSTAVVNSPKEKRIAQAVRQEVVTDSTAPFVAVAVNWMVRRYRTELEVASPRSLIDRVDLCRRAGCRERRTVGAYCAEHAATPVDLSAMFGSIDTSTPVSSTQAARDKPAAKGKKRVERTATMQVTARRRVVLKPKGS